MAVDGAARGMAGLALSQTADVAAIRALIPAQASTSNQLADKEFVNSTVATETAHLVTNNGAPFESVAELEAYTGTVTNNDYAYVVTRNAQQVITAYNRYKYSSATSAWAFEFTLNNSSFTAAQWAAINSGVTAALLASFLTDTDYATTDTAGVIFANADANFVVANGVPKCQEMSYAEFLLGIGTEFISDGTVKAIMYAGSSTLDSELVPGKQYTIGSKSATFAMVLPSSGTYHDTIEVIFSATAAFTPTTSGGTVAGDTIPACVSGKTYDFLFTWTGSAWLFQYLYW